MSMNVSNTLEALAANDDSLSAPRTPSTNWIAAATEEQITDLLRGVLELATRRGVEERSLGLVLRCLGQSSAWVNPKQSSSTDADTIRQIYMRLESECACRHLLLTLLAQRGTAETLTTFSDLVVTDPPVSSDAVVEAFAPLWKRENAAFQALFPRLLDALSHPVVATVVLDLTNYLASHGRVEPHPAEQRRPQLLDLFAHLIERLEQYEESSIKHGVTDLQTAQQVADSVSLAVALSYTLALIKDDRAIGKLYRMMDLHHRRLRVEAASALARLQEEAGKQALVELAAEPSVRLSVLAYAGELGMLDNVDAQFRSPVARAEAELVSRMAEPAYFGVPPNECDLIDQRSLHWPSFEGSVDCFLFRFTYHLVDGEMSNIGIVGPLTHCFAADLTDWSMDDVYAAFAGWQAEHEEIQEMEIDPENSIQAVEIQRRRRRLEEVGFESVRPEFIGSFFGQRSLIAAANKDGVAGLAVVSDEDHLWRPQTQPNRPLSPEIVYALYKGHKLLQMFN